MRTLSNGVTVLEEDVRAAITAARQRAPHATPAQLGRLADGILTEAVTTVAARRARQATALHEQSGADFAASLTESMASPHRPSPFFAESRPAAVPVAESAPISSAGAIGRKLSTEDELRGLSALSEDDLGALLAESARRDGW